MERSSSSSPGFVSRFNTDAQDHVRLTSSGGSYEFALTADVQAGLIWWTTCGNDGVYKASLADVNSKTLIWTGTQCPWGLAVSITDKLVFVDQETAGLVMLNYDGQLINTLTVTGKGPSYGLAIDEVKRLVFNLY